LKQAFLGVFAGFSEYPVNYPYCLSLFSTAFLALLDYVTFLAVLLKKVLDLK
jgi:hypothetical protein